VAQDDDLDGELVAIVAEKPDELKNTEKGEIAERESHRPYSSDSLSGRKSRSSYLDDVLGTDRAENVVVRTLTSSS
jgi:hypothetical protein